MRGLDARGAGLVLAVFLAGAAVGALAFRTVAHRRMAGAFEGREGQGIERMFLRALDRRVDLDDAQRARVASILDEAHAARRRILAPVEPELDALRRRNEARIREVLRPDQRPAFDAFCARMAERHRAGFPPPLPPPPEGDVPGLPPPGP